MSNLILATQHTNTNQHDLWRCSVIHTSEQPDGTLGFIMNQPVSNIDYKQISKIYGINALPKSRVWCGGPVMTDRCTVMHTRDYCNQDTRDLSEHACITFNNKIVEDIQQGRGPKHYKIMLGFCRWESGQLDAEITRGMWLCSDHSDLVWSSYKMKDKMWQRIIERDSTSAAKTFLDSLTVQ